MSGGLGMTPVFATAMPIPTTGSSTGTRRPRAAIRVRPTIAAVMPNRFFRMSPTTLPTPASPTRLRASVRRSKGSQKPEEISASDSSKQSPNCPLRSGQQRALHGLVAREAAGNLSDEQRAELAELRRSLNERIQEIAEFWRESPEIAAAFLEYVAAVRTRPELADAAYRAGARDALTGRGGASRAETLILLNAAPGLMATRLLRRRGRRGDGDRTDDLADALLAEAALA